MSEQRTFLLREMKKAGGFLQFPEDYRKGCALVTMVGRERVCIENFKGICSYTEQEISLTTSKSRICVKGRRLRIDSYAKDQIEISGMIEMVRYD